MVASAKKGELYDENSDVFTGARCSKGTFSLQDKKTIPSTT